MIWLYAMRLSSLRELVFAVHPLGEAAMKPTDEDDEKVDALKRKTLPTFVLAVLSFMLTVVGASALWWFMIAAIRR
jgi:hypothetical protein